MVLLRLGVRVALGGHPAHQPLRGGPRATGRLGGPEPRHAALRAPRRGSAEPRAFVHRGSDASGAFWGCLRVFLLLGVVLMGAYTVGRFGPQHRRKAPRAFPCFRLFISSSLRKHAVLASRLCPEVPTWQKQVHTCKARRAYHQRSTHSKVVQPAVSHPGPSSYGTPGRRFEAVARSPANITPVQSETRPSISAPCLLPSRAGTAPPPYNAVPLQRLRHRPGQCCREDPLGLAEHVCGQRDLAQGIAHWYHW